jgi:chemotaxis regulatin CheY-phosphate phosphatase CheZ
MSSLNIDEVLTKIDDLRGLFELGQRTMPFLEELFHFLEEIEPLLGEIDASIRESANKMPAATSKLESVSEATEVATSEILNLVDSVAFELKMMQKALNRKTEGLDAVREADERLLQLLDSELGEEHADLMEEVQRIHRRKQPLLEEAIDHADDEREAVDDVRKKMTQITMSLQVQDITSQQIAAVNHIIESLRDRMGKLVDHTTLRAEDDASESPEAAPSSPNGQNGSHEKGTFDENARYDPGGNHQSLADELIDSIKQPEDDASPPAPAAEAASPSPTEAASEPDDPDAATGNPDAATGDALPTDDSGEIAQEDIDELFS